MAGQPTLPRIHDRRAALSTIYHDVLFLFQKRSLFRQTNRIIEGNPVLSPSNLLMLWLAENYALAVATGILRQANGLGEAPDDGQTAKET